MIRNYIAFRDWETGSRNKHKCQPLQLACVMIDMKKLLVVPDSTFEAKLRPEFDNDKAIAMGFDPLDDESLAINHLTKQELANAPEPQLVWEQYIRYLSTFNLKGTSGGKWDAPAIGGYNNIGFDDFIDRRMCERYGPKLDKYGGWALYHPFYNFDVQQFMQSFFHAHPINPHGYISMDAARAYFGYKTDGAHDAKTDVLQGADLLIRFLKLIRHIMDGKLKGRVHFKGAVNGVL